MVTDRLLSREITRSRRIRSPDLRFECHNVIRLTTTESL